MKSLCRISGLALTLLFAGVCNAACNLPLIKPDSIYLDKTNGTVIDNETGLVWLKCPVGLGGDDCLTGTARLVNWNDASKIAGDFAAAGRSDWRLPNVKELASLADKACAAPAINSSLFPATSSAAYWTSSPSGEVADSVFSIDFATGGIVLQRKDSLNPVRLVRYGY